MEQVAARAALVSTADVGPGLSTSVSRQEIEEALRAADATLELVLEITRFEQDGEPAETRDVAVEWERADVERLLAETSGDSIPLTFDGETLRQAFEDDVEAHGFREKALVLAVVVAAAGAGAGKASASLCPPDHGPGARAVPISHVTTMAAHRPADGKTRSVAADVSQSQPAPGDLTGPRITLVGAPSWAESAGLYGMILAITGATFAVVNRRHRRGAS